jgi:hypothetical protein
MSGLIYEKARDAASQSRDRKGAVAGSWSGYFPTVSKSHKC